MKKILFICTILFIASKAQAAVITTTGSGSAVTVTDRIATFNNISGALLGYTEDNLSISADDIWCCFPNVFYDNGGSLDFVTISTTDGADFFGLELDLGTGFGTGLHNVVWETKRDGNSTGSGILTNVFASNGPSNNPSVLGWSDINLFDTLLIGAAPTANGYNAFGQLQAIALDNVKIDFNGNTPIPEPTSIALLVLGLAGIGFSRKKKIA